VRKDASRDARSSSAPASAIPHSDSSLTPAQGSGAENSGAEIRTNPRLVVADEGTPTATSPDSIPRSTKLYVRHKEQRKLWCIVAL